MPKTTELDTFLSAVLDQAITALNKARADVYTFAFCHDRERGVVFVSADSEANSRRAVREINRASMKQFAKAVRKRDLDEALVWQASIGRNLSVSEFEWAHITRRPLGKHKHAPTLHEAMLLSALEHAPKIIALSSDPETLLFTCSTPDEEVGLIWTADATPSAPKTARTKRAHAVARY